jgi:glycosyltransferase involved in cell wall biosynthesis
MGLATDTITVGVFTGPWVTGHVARDGAVLCFSDIERAVKRSLNGGAPSPFHIVEIDISLFLTQDPVKGLEGMDIVYANCGPLAAFLFDVRARHDLDFTIVREVHTLGWIGYAFQEFVAHAYHRPGDICTHPSEFSRRVWRDFRGAAGDVVYCPILWGEHGQRKSASPMGRGLRFGFFSRLSSDKGLGHVPAILARLRDGGWRLASLDLCGTCVEPGLMEKLNRDVEALGVAATYHGEVSHRRALEVMGGVDIVLFPSMSSYESCGRVVLEAYDLGKTVIATDYCAARDLLADPFRIPVNVYAPAIGTAHEPFMVGDIDLDRWVVPDWRDDNFRVADCERYRYEPSELRRLVEGLVAERNGVSGAVEADVDAGNESLRMKIDWDRFRSRSPADWCRDVRTHLLNSVGNRADLVDLGGVMKRSIVKAGFNPTVAFNGA